jgi:nitrous oxidase accessory protein
MWRPGLIVALLALWPQPMDAAGRSVPAEPGALTQAVAGAEAGDVLRLAPGLHRGAVVIDRPLTIEGGDSAHVVGPEDGSVISVEAADVAIRGLVISGSGSSHEKIDAGIKLGKKAVRAIVEGNRLVGNLYGVDIHGARDALVTGNVIEGRQDHRMNDRGNGVYVWNAPGAVVEGNDIRWGRDGIFANTSKRNVFRSITCTQTTRRSRVTYRSATIWDMP